jgi:TonB-dependent SusC/RagA subfamily outer membrane receptor
MKKKIINTCCVLFAIGIMNLADVCAQEKTDSLVNVAFGKVEKQDLLGAVSTVNVPELMKKSYSTYSLDGMQGYVGGYTGNIWGQSPLVLVDGFPRSASNVNSSEVESVTILKGASAVVLYGSRAAKGVVLITTKRGKAKPLSIDLRVNTGVCVPKRYPNYLNASDYMTLYNEACRNDNIAERYSQELIDNTAAGTNPYRYPDIDFYSSDFLKSFYNKSDVTGEISGGNERARYYSNFGMSHNNSLMKYGDQKNNKDMRFNVRANIDMDLTDWLKASTKALAIFSDSYVGRGDFWGTAASLRPNWFSPLIPVDMLDPANEVLQNIVKTSNNVIDGKYLLGGTSTDQTNAFADMLVAGYIKNKSRVFQFDVDATADLGSLLKGLTFKTAYSVDYTDRYSEAWKEGYAVYEPTWATVDGKDVITALKKYNDDTNSTNEYIGETSYAQTMTFSSQFNYNRSFNESHNVSATLVGWGFQIRNSSDSNHEGSVYHNTTNVNLGMQATYNYLHKYYIDLAGAVVHSPKLPENNRNAFSPSVTLGWRMSDEDFFKNSVSFVNNLK